MQAPHPLGRPVADRGHRSAIAAVATFLAAIVAGAALYWAILREHVVPSSDQAYLRLALVLALGVVAIVVVGRIVHALVARIGGLRHAGLVDDLYRIASYSVLGVIALAVLGVNGYALLAGGTFAGLVIGLASQTALANLVAGLVLVLARPFEPSDRLTLSTWQYSFLLPSYPPKFYSADLLIPGFTGTVQDIGLLYTTVRSDDGPIVRFPNSIVISAAVILHTLDERWVRLKYDVPSSVDPTKVMAAVREAVVADDWVVGKSTVRVLVNQATAASYIVSVDALCAGGLEEPPRSALYVRVMRAVAALLPPSTGTPPGPTAAPAPTQPPPPVMPGTSGGLPVL